MAESGLTLKKILRFSREKDQNDLRHFDGQMLDLTDLGELTRCINIQHLFLKGNSLFNIDGIGQLRRLKQVDLSCNRLSSLPGPDIWLQLPDLKFLDLFQNSFRSLDALQSLVGCKGLMTLTCYWNPVSVDPDYRFFLLRLLPSLLALDDQIASEEETADDARTMSILKLTEKFSSFSEAMRLPPVGVVTRRMAAREHEAEFRARTMAILSLYARLRPAVLVQRVFRGHLGRRLYSFIRMDKIDASNLVKRNWVAHKNKLTSLPVVDRLWKDALAQAQPSVRLARREEGEGHHRVFEEPRWFKDLPPLEFSTLEPPWGLMDPDSSIAVYTHPRHYFIVEKLAQEASQFSLTREEVAEREVEGQPVKAFVGWSAVRIIRKSRGLSAGVALPLVGNDEIFPGSLMRCDHPCRTLHESVVAGVCRIRTFAPLDDFMGTVVLRRRRGRPDTKTRVAFVTCFEKSVEPPATDFGVDALSENESRSGEVDGGEAERRRGRRREGGVEPWDRLIRIEFPTPQSRVRFMRIVAQVNAGIERKYALANLDEKSVLKKPPCIWSVGEEVIARITAGHAIRAAIKSHLVRKINSNSLHTLVKRKRAVTYIQQWWRFVVIKTRIRALMKVRAIFRNSPSNSVYADPDIMEQLHTAGARRIGMFPESKFHFDFDQGSIMWFPFQTKGVPTDKVRRLPLWVGGPPDLAGVVASQRKIDSLPAPNTLSQVTITNNGTTVAEDFPAIHAPPASLPLRGIASVGIIRVQRVERGKSTASVGRSPVGRRPLLKLTYETPKEAFVRAVMVLLATWRARDRSHIAILPAAMLLEREAVVCLQSIWRGFCVRKWFRPRRRLLQKHLGTSIFEQRTLVWRKPADLIADGYSAGEYEPPKPVDDSDDRELRRDGSGGPAAMTLAERNVKNATAAREKAERLKREMEIAVFQAKLQKEVLMEEKRARALERRLHEEKLVAPKADQSLSLFFIRKVTDQGHRQSDLARELEEKRRLTAEMREAHERSVKRNEATREQEKERRLNNLNKWREEGYDVAQKRHNQARTEVFAKHDGKILERERAAEGTGQLMFSKTLVNNMNMLDSRSSVAELQRRKELDLAARLATVEVIKRDAERKRNRAMKLHAIEAERRRRETEKERRGVESALAYVKETKLRELANMHDKVVSMRMLRSMSRPQTTPLNVVNSIYDIPFDVSNPSVSPPSYNPLPTPAAAVRDVDSRPSMSGMSLRTRSSGPQLQLP